MNENENEKEKDELVELDLAEQEAEQEDDVLKREGFEEELMQEGLSEEGEELPHVD